MSFVFISLFVVILVAVMLLSLMKKDNKQIEKMKVYPYLKRPSLYTPTERAFKHKLQLAVDEQYDIASKVRLSDLLTVKHTKSKSASQKASQYIQLMYVDFVLSDTETSEILCAIKLNNSSDAQPDKQHNAFIDNALRAAKIPLLHFFPEENAEPQLIADKVKKAIHPEFAIHESSAIKADDIKILINPDN